jgi:hypothetical protein
MWRCPVRRHSLDLFSLFAGLIFVGFATAYVIGAYTTLHVNPKLVVPVLLVGLGVAGLVGAVVGQYRSDKRVAAAALESESASESEATQATEPVTDSESLFE